MNTTPPQQNIPDLVQLKLEAFDRLQHEFEISFQFLQEAHGQKRFPAFPVAEVVRCLHARWLCEYKGRLLSVAKTVKEYDGERCLELIAPTHYNITGKQFVDRSERSDEGMA